MAQVAAVAAVVVLTPTAAHAESIAGYQKPYFDLLKMDQVQDISQGAGVTVAVIDTGVDATHPDLAGRVVPGHGIGAGAAGDGRADSGSHGTMMAGTIAGAGGGDNRVRGIAPRATIMPVALAGEGVSLRTGTIAEAIRWAADHDADVINVSLSSETAATDALVDAVRYATGRDAVVVSGAGNRSRGQSVVGAPANVPGVIAVTGTDSAGGYWDGSVAGPEAVLAAPGTKVVGAQPRSLAASGAAFGDGTSASAAIVSGVAALVRSKFPELDAANVVNRLLATADDKGATGRDAQYGYGLIYPLAALTAQIPDVSTHPLLPASPADEASPRGAPQASENLPPVTASWNALPPALILAVAAIMLVVLLAAVVLIVRRRASLAAAAPGPGGPYPPGYAPAPGWLPNGPHPPPYPGQWPPPPAAGQAPPPPHPQVGPR